MHNLRSALGRSDESEEVSLSRLGPSRLYNKSKSGMWALEAELEEEGGRERGQAEGRLRANFQSIVQATFKSDPNFSEMCFYEIIDKLSPESKGMLELECLLAIESSARGLAGEGEERFRGFATALLECLVRRIRKLQRKEKKNELQEYDKIVQNNFRRKGGAQFIDEDQIDRKQHLEAREQKMGRMNQGSKDRVANGSQGEGSSRHNGSSSSTQGRLGKLLSNPKLKEEKKNTENGEEHAQKAEESVSFASVVSQSMAVRQRRPKQDKRSKKEKEVGNEGVKKEEGDSQNKDEAFIFYRPKAGKKK